MAILETREPISQAEIKAFLKKLQDDNEDMSWEVVVNGIHLIGYSDLYFPNYDHYIKNPIPEFSFSSGNGEGFWFYWKDVYSLVYTGKTSW